MTHKEPLRIILVWLSKRKILELCKIYLQIPMLSPSWKGHYLTCITTESASFLRQGVGKCLAIYRVCSMALYLQGFCSCLTFSHCEASWWPGSLAASGSGTSRVRNQNWGNIPWGSKYLWRTKFAALDLQHSDLKQRGAGALKPWYSLSVLLVLRFLSYPCCGFSISMLKIGSLIVSFSILLSLPFKLLSFPLLNSKIPMDCISRLARSGEVALWRSSYPLTLSHLSIDDWMVMWYTFQYRDVGMH